MFIWSMWNSSLMTNSWWMSWVILKVDSKKGLPALVDPIPAVSTERGMILAAYFRNWDFPVPGSPTSNIWHSPGNDKINSKVGQQWQKPTQSKHLSQLPYSHSIPFISIVLPNLSLPEAIKSLWYKITAWFFSLVFLKFNFQVVKNVYSLHLLHKICVTNGTAKT